MYVCIYVCIYVLRPNHTYMQECRANLASGQEARSQLQQELALSKKDVECARRQTAVALEALLAHRQATNSEQVSVLVHLPYVGTVVQTFENVSRRRKT